MKDLKSTTHVILVLLVGIVLASCSSDSGSTQPNTSSSKRYVGEAFGGGVVFYTWKDAQGTEHGLVVSIKNQSDSCVWSNVLDTIGASARSRYDGKSNTAAIISQPGHTTSAALLCKTYSAGGFNDWYLPTLQELGVLYLNIPAVNLTLASIAGATQFNNFIYWSSIEGDGDGSLSVAGMIRDQGDGAYLDKSYKFPVRAIRSF